MGVERRGVCAARASAEWVRAALRYDGLWRKRVRLLARPPPGLALPPMDEAHVAYRGRGWLAMGWCEVTCWSGAAGCALAVAGAGLFHVAADGRTLTQVETEAGAAEELVTAVVLGPALILALARQGVWCLHAGGAGAHGRAIALLGVSGAGKSTLAAYLGECGAPDWRQVGDDVLPAAVDGNEPCAMPHFPQLKLPPQAQPARGAPERMPLAHLYALSPDAPSEGSVAIEPLRAREAALVVARHTVAARLFDPALLAAHAAFCAEMARRIPVRRLSFPRRLDVLPDVRRAIEADLGAGHAFGGSAWN